MTRIIAFAIALLISVGAYADTRVVNLKHRPADQVAALIQPFVPAGAGVIATDGRLIFHGDPESLDELSALVEQLDVAAKRLRISVRDSGELFRSDQRARVDGTLSQPRLDAFSSRSRERPLSEHTVQVMEGEWARIDMGQSIPLQSQTTIIGPNGAVVQQGTQYQDVNSGFEVLPRVSGNTVTLDIRAYGGIVPAPGGIIRHDETRSTVQIPLGEWADLSGISGTQHHDASGTFYAAHSRESVDHHLQVKVELEP